MKLLDVVLFGEVHSGDLLEPREAPSKRVVPEFGADDDGQERHEDEPFRAAHFAPLFPVYGLTLPFALQLSALEAFGDVRTDGARYAPAFVMCPRTRTAFAAKAEGHSSRAKTKSTRIPRNDTISAGVSLLAARSVET